MENKIINAIHEGNSNEVESLLREGANVNFVNYQTGNSFLHLAIEKDNEAIVKVLIDNKINLEIRNIAGMTPLHSAIGYRRHGYSEGINSNNPNIVRLLLNAGALVDALDKNGLSPLFKVAEVITRNDHVTSIGGNSMGNIIMQTREVMKILLENGASIFAGHGRNIPAARECVHTVLAEIKLEQALQKLQKQFEQQIQKLDIVEPENIDKPICFTQNGAEETADDVIVSNRMVTTLPAPAKAHPTTPIVIHHPPVVLNTPSTQVVEVNKPFYFTFEANEIFNDKDGEPLTFQAQSSDGTPLPPWVLFGASASTHLTFAGKPLASGDTELALLANNPWNQTAQTKFSLSAVTKPQQSNVTEYLMGGAVGLGFGALIGLGYGFYKKSYLENVSKPSHETLKNEAPLLKSEIKK